MIKKEKAWINKQKFEAKIEMRVDDQKKREEIQGEWK